MEPLPPVKEVEYRCFIGKVFEELSGMEYMTFAFETAKEFSSFRYEIAVRYRIQPGLLEFKVLGMTATRTMMPAFGTARSVLKIPLLPYGIYNVKLIKSDDTENMFTIEVSKKGFQILLPIPRKRFIDLIIETKAAAPNARHLSTISKTPPVPLVPRTIQKRVPSPMDGEPSDFSEAPEEPDMHEEKALFDVGRPPKSGAKHAIEEIEEVPASVKQKGKPKAEPKPAKASKAVAKEKKSKDKPAKATKKPAAKAKVKPTPKKAPAKKKSAPKPKPKAKPKPAKKSAKKKK